MSENNINPYDAIIAFEGSGIALEVDRILKGGKVDGWLQIVVLKKGNGIHIFPQGYGIGEKLARKAVKHALDSEYANEAAQNMEADADLSCA